VQPSPEQHPSRTDRSRTDRLPRRPTDHVEDATARVLTVAALFVLLAGVLGGVAVRSDAVDFGEAAEQERRSVSAVLLSDGTIPYGTGLESLRPARYVDAGGEERDVLVAVAGQPSVGTVVRVWVDRDGRLVPSPPDGLDALVLGVAAAAGMVIIGGAVFVGLCSGVRRCFEVRNAAEWSREWAEVEPRWTGRGC
jgi:hypothetical protein